MGKSFYGKKKGYKSIKKKKKYERKRGKFLWEHLRNSTFTPTLLKTWAQEYHSRSFINPKEDESQSDLASIA
jgi:hypothetical protein